MAPVAQIAVDAHGQRCAQFQAMASPCSVMADGADDAELLHLGTMAARQAHRIEQKWSRYLPSNLVHCINHANGGPVTVDEETARLLDFAALVWRESGGLFDITSGVLRRAWRFDGSDRVPAAPAVAALLPLVGWDKASWRRPELRLLPGMEIDFGGIGKEYAVDVTLGELAAATTRPVLVNFGGDLAVSGPRRGDEPWRVGIDSGEPTRPAPLVRLSRGAVTTSGDAHRYLLKDGVRYPHILDPRSGWPVMDAPRSVTVAAASCAEAGVLSTLAMLHGATAESFLAERGVEGHVVR
jgi:thiamine biosynthesis lipoprotein